MICVSLLFGMTSVPVLVPTLSAQTSKGMLSGTVRDASGAVIANATITVTNEQTSETRTTLSNNQGDYRIDAINIGSYSIHVEARDFQTLDVKALKVNPSVVTSYDPTLKVGSAVATVEVEASSNNINTDNAQLSGTIDNSQLRTVPVFTLNPVELATTVPGVQLVDTKIDAGFSNGVNIQVNGARPRANNFLIDGADINDVSIGGQAIQVQIPEITASETVLTNAYSAEYGGAGGAVVNMITRSGSNQLHGSAWELYSGSGLNSLDGQQRLAKNYNKNRYNQHQFGFSLGGPVLRDKLFFFGSAQWSRYYGKGQPGKIALPTQAGYSTLQSITTDNSKLLQQLLGNGTYLSTFTQASGDPGTGSVNPADCPDPSVGCSVPFAYFYRPAPAQKSPDTQWIYRVDYLPRAADTFSFRYFHDRQSVSPDFGLNPYQFPGFDTLQGGPSEIGSGTWTHIFTPNLLNEFRATETRLSFMFDLTPEAKANPLSQLPTITIPGISGLVPLGAVSGDPQGRSEDLYQLQDTLSWTKGRHTLRVGFDLGKQIEIEIVPFNRYGTLQFAGGKSGPTSSFANFLDNYLGASGQAQKAFGTQRFDPHAFRQRYFVQDDIKLTSDLTANIGLRYEYQENPENSLSYPALDPKNPFSILQLNSSGNVVPSVIKVKNDKNNFGPRVGLAYNPHLGTKFLADGKTVYHAGYGIFYDPLFSNIVVNTAATTPNVVSGMLTSTTDRGLANATGLISQISPTLTLNSSVTSVVNNLVNPMTQQWNLGFERALPGDIKWTVAYVGTRGEKLFANQQYNYFSAATAERLNPSYGAVNARGNFADSIYHGLQTQVSHDFRHGFQANATYSYSKSLDNGSEVFATFNQQTSYAANLAPGGRAAEWGPSAYDHRHYASFVYVWAVPGLHSQDRMLDAVLSGATRHWTISGTTQFQSGPYSTWNFSGVDSNGDGNTANDRPIEMNRKAAYTAVGIDGANLGLTPGTYYDMYSCNTKADCSGDVVDPTKQRFLVPYGQSGNVSRDSYANPGLQFWNVAVQKDIPLHLKFLETGALQFRCEAQNVGNHNNVGPLDTNLLDIGSGPFLDKSNARETDSRQIRFWAKFNF